MLTDRSPLTRLNGVGPVKSAQLKELGLDCIADLLDLLPRDYLDLSAARSDFDFSRPGLYRGEIRGLSLRYLRRRRSITVLSVECGQSGCRLSFFNQPYLKNQLHKGDRISFYGRPEMYRDHVTFTQPRLLTEDSPSCLPLYPALGPFGSGWLRGRISAALEDLRSAEEDLPEGLVRKNRLGERLALWRTIHQPDEVSAAVEARERLRIRLAYKEYLLFHLQLALIRRKLRERPRQHRYTLDENFRSSVRKRLPFTLTTDQKQGLREIMRDIAGPRTMQRLLCGDVGCGKTVVAFIALQAAIHSGHQGALLAPTEVLCRQHLMKARAFFPDYRIELLTGETPEAEAGEIRRDLQRGMIQLIIGTHALLSENTRFHDLSMVVIDEQHRFGVSQRAALMAKGNGLDLLVTSATPIPRTLLLSLYSDLSVTTIQEMPPGRKEIVTRRVDPEERLALYRSLVHHLDEGEKIYIVVPRIVPDEENPELQSLEKLASSLSRLFGARRLVQLHGRMSSKEKEAALERFRAGGAPVMLATTVIEVGIDDPLATVMVVENADRYGLAALHQLRGRIGRGSKQAFCWLIPSTQSTPAGEERLRILCRHRDGFYIARKDLEMRGGGLIAGQEQVGRPSFRHGDPLTDRTLFEQARRDVADEISLDSPPESLKEMVQRFESQIRGTSFS